MMPEGEKKTGEVFIKTVILVTVGFLLLTSLVHITSAQTSQEEITEFIRTQPLEPVILDRLKEVLDDLETEDMKFRMELTRRIDFYFYVSDHIDSLMNLYVEDLMPMIYQRDLFQGNSFKNTKPLLHEYTVLTLLNTVITVLQPFYAISILATGVYLLFISSSPQGRAKAKSTLVKLVIGLGLITLTLPIIGFLLELSHYLTSTIIAIPEIKEIYKPVDVSMFMAAKEFFIKYFLRLTFFDILSGLPFLSIIIMLPLTVLMVLSLRYFMVILLTIMFPFTVLLYSFISTRRVGRSLIYQTLTWTFTPVADAVVILTTWAGYESIEKIPDLAPETYGNMKALIAITGFIMLTAAPFMVLYVLRWMNSLGLVSVMIINPARNLGGYFEKGELTEDLVEEEKEEKEEITKDYEEIREEVEGAA